MQSKLIAGVALLIALAAAQELPKQELRKKLKDDVHPAWIYDDLPAAFASAKQSGKPILAVFRCVP